MCKEKKNSIYDQYHIHHICLNTINVILVAINSNIIVGHLQDIDRKMMPFTPCQFHSLLSVLSFPSLLDIFFIMLTTSTNKKNNQNMWNSRTHSTRIMEPTQTMFLLS